MSVAVSKTASLKSVRLGLLGIGDDCRLILQDPKRVRLAKIVAAADVTGAAIADLRAANIWRDPIYDPRPDRLCSVEQIDALRIDVPLPVRFEYVERALRHGKSVLATAPLVGTLGEAAILHEIAQRKQLVLATGFALGRRAEFRQLCSYLRHGLIGRLLEIDIELGSGGFMDAREFDTAWQCRRHADCGGASMDLGSRAFAAALRLAEYVPGGCAEWEFESAELSCGRLIRPAHAGNSDALVDESASGRFRFGNFGFVWRATWLERREETSAIIKLRGTGGMLIADFNEQVIRGFDRERQWSIAFPPVDRRDLALRELSEFCRAVLKRDLRRNDEASAVQAMLEQVRSWGMRRASPPPG
jgi:predicted dehydrogenase